MLSILPLSSDSAEWWANLFRTWPAIFKTPEFRKEIAVRHGIRMQVGLIDVIERNLLVNGEWDEPVCRGIAALLRPGSTFVDIGANVGYFSLIASRIVGENGLVIAVEPQKRALQRMLKNFSLNDTSNVVLLTVAAGSTTALGSLKLATPNNIGASTLRPAEHIVGEQRVPVVRLDGVLRDLGVVPDLIKIDVEGYELHALKGLQPVLQDHRPMVLAELTCRFLNDLDQNADSLISFMERFGYSCFEIVPGQNFRVARLHSAKGKAQTEVLFAGLSQVSPEGYVIR